MAVMREFIVRAEFDPDAGVWWASNDDLPLTTEAPSLDQLMARVMAIAPEIAEANGHAKRGEHLKIYFTTEREVAAGG
jgi:hypothetical protein